jgi:thioredoxin 1
MVTKYHTETDVYEEEFEKIINHTHRLVVVDFYTEWCMPCLMMSPIIEDMAHELKNVKFVRINSEDNTELASRMNISTIPCIVVFKDGKESGRIIGVHSYDKIENKIREFLK